MPTHVVAQDLAQGSGHGLLRLARMSATGDWTISGGRACQTTTLPVAEIMPLHSAAFAATGRSFMN